MKIIEWFYSLFGRGYLVDEETMEIHKVKGRHKDCLPVRNGKYVSLKKANRLVEDKGYYGCLLCWKICALD